MSDGDESPAWRELPSRRNVAQVILGSGYDLEIALNGVSAKVQPLSFQPG